MLMISLGVTLDQIYLFHLIRLIINTLYVHRPSICDLIGTQMPVSTLGLIEPDDLCRYI